MKSLTNYIKDKLSLISLSEKLVICHQQVDEKLVINKDYTDGYNYHPNDKDELMSAIQEHYDKGVFDLNDIDVSKIDDFSDLFFGDKNVGNEEFDISKWNVSGGNNFEGMFFNCQKFNCDLSKWDVSNGTNFCNMFFCCKKFNCDLSKWNVSNGKDFRLMFMFCYELNFNSNEWNIMPSAKTYNMFHGCSHMSNE